MLRLSWILVALVSLATATALAEPSRTAAEQGGETVSTKKAQTKTGIQWNVSPANALVYLDGKKLGSAGDLTGKITKADPGKHTIKLTKGGDEQEMEVKVVKGQVLRIDFEFSE
jgi:hypothetical protein